MAYEGCVGYGIMGGNFGWLNSINSILFTVVLILAILWFVRQMDTKKKGK
ncbi:hypothetical protein H6503_03680 [Candidatus Woesearchaeota archaeon]|nr:hypothetical protein [Candidatus Woesearchaeota archaeon]